MLGQQYICKRVGLLTRQCLWLTCRRRGSRLPEAFAKEGVAALALDAAAACHASHVTRHASRITRHTSRITQRMSHSRHETSYLQMPSSMLNHSFTANTRTSARGFENSLTSSALTCQSIRVRASVIVPHAHALHEAQGLGTEGGRGRNGA